MPYIKIKHFSSDETAAVYTSGCFNIYALIADAGYTITENDKGKLRECGMQLDWIFEQQEHKT